jgi:Tfp pilus assembly protein FimT
LLELLITVAVIGITVTLGAPAIIDSFKSQKVKGATQSGYFMLQYARSVAISKGTDVTIDFVSGNNWCLGVSDSGPCECNVANSCLVDNVEQRVVAADYSGVQMNNLTFNGGTSVIDGQRGMAAGNAGTLELSDGDNTLRLVMSNLARVRICSAAGDPGDYPAC